MSDQRQAGFFAYTPKQGRPKQSKWQGALLLLGLALCGCQDKTKAEQQAQTSTLPTAKAATSPPAVPPASPAVPAKPVPPTRDAQGCLVPPAYAAPPAAPPQLSGQLGLWVAQIDPQTLAPLRVVAQAPTQTFPLASTYKQAVLWAVLREFDAGRLSPEERFHVSPQNQSLGVYPFDGTNVRNLSSRMIAQSDNTATDILHRRVGLQKVQDTTDKLGLCQSRVILPTKDWWYLQVNLAHNQQRMAQWQAARGDERLRLAQRIDQEAQGQRPDQLQGKLNTYFETRYQLDDDLKVHNYSTPYEWATFLGHFYLRPELSARAQTWQQEVMQQGFGRGALQLGQHKIKRFGGKGGNGWKILTYSGYLETEDGKHVVYAFMQHGCDQTYTMPNTRAAFQWLSAAVSTVLSNKPLTLITDPQTGDKQANQRPSNASSLPPLAPAALPSSLEPKEGAQEIEVELPELSQPTDDKQQGQGGGTP